MSNIPENTPEEENKLNENGNLFTNKTNETFQNNNNSFLP
jgi:hypothetical protein